MEINKEEIKQKESIRKDFLQENLNHNIRAHEYMRNKILEKHMTITLNNEKRKSQKIIAQNSAIQKILTDNKKTETLCNSL